MAQMKAAFLSGDHPFDVVSMQNSLAEIGGMRIYPQHLLDFCTDAGEGEQIGRSSYDVLVFYNMTMKTPSEDDSAQKVLKEQIEAIGSAQQGLAILHHAILAYPEWQAWSDIVGIKNREFGFHPDQSVSFNVEAPDHPIMDGISDFNMIDETYTMKEPDESSTLLLSTTHDLSMKSIAWCREYQNARVFCYQSGHDDTSYSHPNFRTILQNGIFWAAGKL